MSIESARTSPVVFAAHSMYIIYITHTIILSTFKMANLKSVIFAYIEINEKGSFIYSCNANNH